MFSKLKQIGPGAMVAAAFIGPGTVTTASIAGANYGYSLLWAVLFSVIATYILQEMSSRLGVIAQLGIGEAIGKKFTGLKKIIASLLVLGAILIGNAAYEAGNISGAVLGFQAPNLSIGSFQINPAVWIIGLLAFVLLYSGKFKLIEKSLIALVSIMGIVFLLSAILVKPDMGAILLGLFKPSIPDNAILSVIALIGTTVVPYNLFLHAATVKKKWKGEEGLAFSKFDTAISILLGGLITMAILITASVAFHSKEIPMEGLSELAGQLQPLLGSWSKTFIALGFLAAGLSSAITAPLAAAYATSEILDWKEGLRGRRFRIIWIFVLLTGILFSSLGFKPLSVIYFAQIANGLLLPILAIFLLWIMNDKNIMGKWTNTMASNIFGFLVIVITIILGLRGIGLATGII